MPARVTSSRNHSTRSSTRPVTSGASRNRQVRAGASRAVVTAGSNGKPSGSGSARVTRGQGGSVNVKPGRARADRISSASRAARPIGDGPKVRAAQAQGQRAAAEAQARRGARAAMGRMEGKLAGAAAGRAAAAAGKLAGKAGLVAAAVNARNTADGTLTAAQRRGDYKPRTGPAVPANRTQAAFDKKDFNSAFGRAREAGKKTFTWRGKRYTTEIA